VLLGTVALTLYGVLFRREVFSVDRGGLLLVGLGGGATPRLALGVAGGLLAAASYAGTTLLARFAVPRYGVLRVLLLEIAGGTVLLGIILPLAFRTPVPPATGGGWVYLLALVAGTVLLANSFFFSGAKRIKAAPTAVAATIEPVVGTLLALALLSQHLTLIGWFGLLLVVAAWQRGTSRRRALAPHLSPPPASESAGRIGAPRSSVTRRAARLLIPGHRTRTLRPSRS
jgi:drug/metabolite transporter (DMT)-like permease